MRVVKFGGGTIASDEQVARIAVGLRGAQGDVLVVHGGGKELDELQQQLGIPTEKVDGLRRTGLEARRAALMVLCGSANKQLVAGLQAGGVPALGLSGIDGGLLRCRPLRHPSTDLGYVGEIQRVDLKPLEALLAAGFVPVVASLSLGEDGEIYNVNADQAAAELAVALKADSLDLVSGVAGVEVQGTLLARLSAHELAARRRDGSIHGGMVPKAEAGMQAAQRGVGQVRIADVDGWLRGGGTVLLPGKGKNIEEESLQ